MFRMSLSRSRTTIVCGLCFLTALLVIGADADFCLADGVITGQVVDEAGHPVSGAEVQFFDWSKYQGYAQIASPGDKVRIKNNVALAYKELK